MKEDSYEQIDDLFAQVRLRLGRVRQSDPTTAEELKGLLSQLEDCVESLVVDSLRLKSLESKPQRATGTEERRRKRQVKK